MMKQPLTDELWQKFTRVKETVWAPLKDLRVGDYHIVDGTLYKNLQTANSMATRCGKKLGMKFKVAERIGPDDFSDIGPLYFMIVRVK